MSDSNNAQPRRSAAVILVRELKSSLEVFLVRRHRKSGFMASAFVFPGGVEEKEDEADAKKTAARELFEEAGILFCDKETEAGQREAWRARIHGGAEAREVLGADGVSLRTDELHYYAHWLTPTAERRRYSAQFFVAKIPDGQTPSFDNVETVDQAWVTPRDALDRARELRLPPPQVRTMLDLCDVAESGWPAVVADAKERAANPAIILPRVAPLQGGFALLLPWDPEYIERGHGDALPLDADHPLAVGPSRFILEDETWKNIEAPASAAAD